GLTLAAYVAPSRVGRPSVPATTCARKRSPAAAMGRAFDTRTRPSPCSLFGQVSVAERAAVPLRVTCCPDAMRIARMSAALGCIELFAIGAPDGYQPSTKYWRMMAAAAAAAGVE